MNGVLLRSDSGVWYVRTITISKDTPTLQTIQKYPLHPHDETDYEYEFVMTKSIGFIAKDVEFEITEMINFISEGDEPARQKTIKYAKLK